MCTYLLSLTYGLPQQRINGGKNNNKLVPTSPNKKVELGIVKVMKKIFLNALPAVIRSLCCRFIFFLFTNFQHTCKGVPGIKLSIPS